MATSTAPEAGDGHQSSGIVSVMPILDDLLDLIGRQATATEIGGESNTDIVKKAKELHGQMDEMTTTALNLPGGHVSLEQAKELEAMLDLEAGKRRALLKAFVNTKMDVVDSTEGTGEAELITPAAPGRDQEAV